LQNFWKTKQRHNTSVLLYGTNAHYCNSSNIKKVEREREISTGRVVLLPLRKAPPDNYCGGTVGESPQAGELLFRQGGRDYTPSSTYCTNTQGREK
jgi:hypothetical protein